MSTTDVRTHRAGTTLLITIDRPQARNSVNAEGAALLAEALDELETDPGLRAGVLSGAGNTFSAGILTDLTLAPVEPVFDHLKGDAQ